MDRLFGCILRVFPDAESSTLADTTTLGSLPNWDSMNSVNLTMELESEYGVSLFEREVVLVGHQTVGDVRETVRGAGGAHCRPATPDISGAADPTV